MFKLVYFSLAIFAASSIFANALAQDATGGSIIFELAQQVGVLQERTKQLQEENKKQQQRIANLENKRLSCSAHPSEEHSGFASCPSGKYMLVNWCSGDCSSDDARVVICCSQ